MAAAVYNCFCGAANRGHSGGNFLGGGTQLFAGGTDIRGITHNSRHKFLHLSGCVIQVLAGGAEFIVSFRVDPVGQVASGKFRSVVLDGTQRTAEGTGDKGCDQCACDQCGDGNSNQPVS